MWTRSASVFLCFLLVFSPSCLLLFPLFITEPTALSSEQTAPWLYGACLTLKASLFLSFCPFFFFFLPLMFFQWNLRKKRIVFGHFFFYFYSCRVSVFLSFLTWETSIKIQNVQKFFPNRAVNKSPPVSLRFGSWRPGRKPFSHRPAWPRLLTLTENSRRARSLYKEKRERGGKGKPRR